MKNIAIFISGRMVCYEECLIPLINNLNNKYNIKLFFSINKFSLDKIHNIETIKNELKNNFGNLLGYLNFEDFKLPSSFVENRLHNNKDVFSYNELSCFYNDYINYNLIINYEKENNIEFDIICKTRSDIKFENNDITFNFDNTNQLIIRNKHFLEIRHWGHTYYNTPIMISNDFAYGNKSSMAYFCKTYYWILENDIYLKGNYIFAFEIYITDSILNTVFYKNYNDNPPSFSKEEIIDKFINNPYKIKIIYENNINYEFIPKNIRSKNNFIVNKENVFQYTKTY